MVHSHKTALSEVVTTKIRDQQVPWKEHAILTPRTRFRYTPDAFQYFANICSKYGIGGVYVVQEPGKWPYAYMDAETQQKMQADGYKAETYVLVTQNIIDGNRRLAQ